MLYKEHFYHGLLRKYIEAFGSVFADMKVVRYKDPAARTMEDSRVLVPIEYLAKEKWLSRLVSDPNLDREHAITLPHMGYEISGITPDPSRKRPNDLRYRKRTGPETANAMYTEVPWNIQFTLYAGTKSQDEAFQIIEQILPFFNPDLTVTVKAVPSAIIPIDCPITLDSFNIEDTFGGNFTENRTIIVSFGFTMQVAFYAPVKSEKTISESNIKVTIE